jgi:hypothetical protein
MNLAYVPVPLDRLSEVFRVLGQPSAEVVVNSQPPADAIVFRPWSQDRVIRLRREMTNPNIRALFDLCAARPNKFVTIREIEAKTGAAQPTVRAALAGLTMFLKSRFKTRNWPLEWDFSTGMSRYRMSTDIATWWMSKD